MSLLYVRYQWDERLFGPVFNVYGRCLIFPLESMAW